MSSSASPSSSSSSAWLADGGALFGIGLGEEITSKTMGPQAQIGPYRLIEKLGEGGLGVVWRAEQTAPIQREVAIKLTKPSLHYRADVLSRFELERQALARMQHPNIAAILDAGALADDRPYFVMELVRGVPLTEYCKAHALDVRSRLELFIVICQAVHHAHQKGILHRDLKPSNILVAEQDGQPVPKVIDFGIAKALDDTDPALNDPFFRTQLGALPCATYQYMSPEQASRGQTDIDTRSDIYTLGVILYELLTGKLPLPDDLARSGSFEAIASHLIEAEPTRPSERVTTLGTKTSDLRGDLDWIVLRALERDRERRYESAAALADDLQRHLDHEPVSAGPPSPFYRCGKWIRRHRVVFVSMVAVALSLSAGFVSTWVALQREAQQRRVADEQRRAADASRALAEQRESQALAARDAEAKARAQAESSRRIADTARARAERLINDMLFDLRDQLEPLGRLPLLDQVAGSAQQYFDDIPQADDSEEQQRNRAVMWQNRGSILLAKGDTQGAKQLFEQSLTTMKLRAIKEPNNVLRLHDLALAHERMGAVHESLHDLASAAISYREMKRVFDHLAKHAPSAGAEEWRKDQAVADERLGDLARSQGKTKEAQEHYQAGLNILTKLEENDVVWRRMAVLEGKLGTVDPAQASTHFEREAALWSRVREQHPDDVRAIAGSAIAHGHLASLHSSLDHARAQAEAFARLVQLDPLRPEWVRGEALAQLQLGIALEAAADNHKAMSAYDTALPRFSQLPEAKRDIAAVHLRLAALHFRLREDDKAREHAKLTLTLLNGLTDAEAESWRRTATELLR
ncbi:MAG: protein kinase [Verrucomicrobiaceae bacterium]|nr:protein kinase [Verrucomicrobiaceae bacterium]